MDKRITLAFWAVDILLFAAPFVMPGIIPMWTAWIAIAVAAVLLVYAAFPRRLIPQRWRTESPGLTVGDMAKLTLVHITGGKVGNVSVKNVKSAGFDEISAVEMYDVDSVEKVEVDNIQATTYQGPLQEGPNAPKIVKGHPSLTGGLRKKLTRD